MTEAASSLDETGHRLTRRGRELQVGVVPIPHSVDGGHALVFGQATHGSPTISDGCLVRIHSRCLYGDALRSDDCDCGPELDMAMDMIQHEGAGVLIYLEQEGRGAGLINKARGLQTSERFDLDTFASYARLELSADSRSYELAARCLRDLGLTSVRLLTNNPDKVEPLERAGLTVTRVPLHTWPRSERARKYLQAKRRHRGHHIPRLPAVSPVEHVGRERRTRIHLASVAIPVMALPSALLGYLGVATISAATGLVVLGLCMWPDRRGYRPARRIRPAARRSVVDVERPCYRYPDLGEVSGDIGAPAESNPAAPRRIGRRRARTMANAGAHHVGA
ncbi:GTP cyclohydrolase II [Nocardia anaemiae]|uniref:GTP cyclohydrolase II n=1 Tax=Nocardia anaemiae TaxID=263910 RepID=UPI000A42A0FC|nr:GTP cyclohydrolase II [Nocardia anaemiae]